MASAVLRWPRHFELVPAPRFPGRLFYREGGGWYASPFPASVRPGLRVVVETAPREPDPELVEGAAIECWGTDGDDGWWGGPRKAFRP